jgi:drug/metabolite transporter (DMT)-like permease
VIAILGGLAAAVLWATGTLTSSRASRIVGSSTTVGWVMLVGVVTAGPLTLASGPLPPITPDLACYLVASGVGGVVGLLLAYRALTLGKVGVVSAIASTEGAMAAVMSVATGERLTPPVAAMLCVIAAGVAVVALATGTPAEPDAALPEGLPAVPGPADAPHDERLAVLLAVGAALCFGVSIFSSAQAGRVLSPFAAVLPVRIVGLAGVTVPLALAGRLRLTRRAAPMVVLIGTAEVLGNAAYVVGGRESIAVAAVLASQFAAIAAVVAFLLFRERLTSPQVRGVAAIVAGVAVLTLVRG